MSNELIQYRARIKTNRDGTFAVVAKDLTGNTIVVKQGIAPFNRRSAILEQRMYNLRILNMIRRGEVR